MAALRGISIISGVIFLALTITATAIVYQAGIPLVQKLQDSASVDKMKATLSDLDSVISEVAAEGRGSKRTVYISSDPGKLVINGSTDTITWELDAETPIISPRTRQTFGNLIVGSNLNTKVSEGTYDRITPAVDAYILENSHLIVYVNRSGSVSGSVPIKTSSLVFAIYNKDLNSWWDNPIHDITIDSKDSSRAGLGYTSAEEIGENLPFGKVTAHLTTNYVNYDIHIILESGADFITIEADET